MPRALQVAGQGVVVLRGDRVELVVVAAGAGDGQAQEGLGEDVDLVVDAVRLVLADVDRRMRPLAEEEEAGAEDRLVEALGRVPARPVEQVAGDVLDDELVVGHVGVERADHVVAVAPRRPGGRSRTRARPSRRSGPGRASAAPSARRSGATRAGGRPPSRRRRGPRPSRNASISAGSGGGRSGRRSRAGSGSACRPRAPARGPWPPAPPG